jgi:hypothetical protein
MKRLIVGSTLAMAVTLGMVASAQSTQAPPQSPQPQAMAQSEQKMPEEAVTVVGCIQKESDYRDAHNLGKGGAAGTGAGAGDEFVLIAAAKVPAGAPGATGTSGGATPAGTDAYELSGDKEDDVKAFVGKRVEITGKLKAAKTEAGAPTGGATAAVPGSSDLKLRELDIVSVKEAAGTCPATAAK